LNESTGMAQQIDLNSSISAAQKEVDGWERRATLASNAKPAGPKWPLTLLMWVALALAIYVERGVLLGWLTSHDSSDTVDQLTEILSHTADDIETYRSEYGHLPDEIPIDLLNGVVFYTHEGDRYTLESTYHGTHLRLQGDASGPGPVEALSR
jgi:hypothetical protein